MGFLKKAAQLHTRVGTGILTGGLSELTFNKGGKMTDKLIDNPMGTVFGTGEQPLSGIDQTKNEILNLGYQGLKNEFAQPVEDVAQSEINRGMSALEGSRGDTLRKIQSQIAARGLGTSSVGLNAIKSANQNIDVQKANLSASLPERLRELRLQRIQLALGIKEPTPAFDSGLAPLLGMAAGGYFGGSEGAKVGMGAGQYSSGIFGGQK